MAYMAVTEEERREIRKLLKKKRNRLFNTAANLADALGWTGQRVKAAIKALERDGPESVHAERNANLVGAPWAYWIEE